MLWALILLTEAKLTKDAIIYSVKVRLSIFIVVTGTAITVDCWGDTASFQGAFTVTGNLDFTYVPVVISVGNPDYLQRGHYAINKGTFINIFSLKCCFVTSLVAWWSELLTTNHEVPGSIPGSTMCVFP